VRAQAWNKNGERTAGASTGREIATFSSAGGKRTKLRRGRVGKLI
jgi:hypothetical protein